MEESFSTSWIGEVVEMKLISYHTQSGLFGANNYYSKKHGLVYSALEGGASYELTGARIGGVVYGVITGIVNVQHESEGIPVRTSLCQNYPNPFNPSTTISYELPTASRVTIRVFNALGQEVALLVDEEKAAGAYQVRWTANVPSGVYFYRIQTAQYSECKKMVVLR
jgi:hypothetical protein